MLFRGRWALLISHSSTPTLTHTCMRVHTHTIIGHSGVPEAGSRSVEVSSCSEALSLSSLHTRTHAHAHQQAIMKNHFLVGLAVAQGWSKQQHLFWGNSNRRYFQTKQLGGSLSVPSLENFFNDSWGLRFPFTIQMPVGL